MVMIIVILITSNSYYISNGSRFGGYLPSPKRTDFRGHLCEHLTFTFATIALPRLLSSKRSFWKNKYQISLKPQPLRLVRFLAEIYAPNTEILHGSAKLQIHYTCVLMIATLLIISTIQYQP